MRDCWKTALTLLAVASMVGLAGCGSGSTEGESSAGTSPATAAIAGPDNASNPGATGLANSKPAQDPLYPVVLLDTSLGKIKVRLDAEKAPLTVDNFLHYVEDGFYDQTVFHQAAKDKVVLGGGFTADLVEKQAHAPIRNEAHNGLKNTCGTVAMVRRPDSIDSATCQFFFNLSDNEWLDHEERTTEAYGYCVFGRVIEGMEVVERIGELEVEDTADFQSKPIKTVLINSARRIR